MKASAVCALVVAGMGCAAQMVVPPEIAERSDVVATDGRSPAKGMLINESFKLGQYAIDSVHREISHGRDTTDRGVVDRQMQGGYRYKFSGAGTKFSGKCTTKVRTQSYRESAAVTLSTSSVSLGCTCSAGAATVTLNLTGSSGVPSSGELKTSTGTYRLTALFVREGPYIDEQPTGYRLDGDTSYGAVEVLWPGRAWFSRDADERERTELACLYAALMLYLP